MNSIKSKFTALLGCGAFLSVAACVVGSGNAAGEASVKPADPVNLESQRRKTVAQLYAENCSNCHGENGEGGGGGTRSILNREKFEQTHDRPFFEAIKNGVADTPMPAYKDSLTDEQIWGLVVRLRELQGKALRAQFGSPKAENGVYRSKRHNFKVETVVEEGQGLATPWGMDWLPDGRMLVTNRPGQVLLFAGGKATVITGIPKSLETGQGGMLDVAVNPNYKNNGWIYLAFTDPAKEGRGSMTKVVRGKLNDGNGAPSWTGEETIFEVGQEFYTRASHHYGSRIVFDKLGHIFFVVGERGSNQLAQELTNPFGKIYRLNED